jgi:peroxiredoxin
MSDTKRLRVGDPAPDFTLLGADGQPVALNSLWQGGPTLLTFLRHFG